MENLSRLDELQIKYDDPVSHFKKIAEERTFVKNAGYSVLKELYKQLELDKFWKRKLRNTSIKYDLEAVFRLLLFSRILF